MFGAIATDRRCIYIGLVAATRAGLGFKLHTGWAALVVVTGRPGALDILLRRRIELLPADGSIPRFVYHEAAELAPDRARDAVAEARKAARRCSEAAVRKVISLLEQRRISVQTCGMPKGSTAVPDDLSKILASHALIHAAEGALFQDALAAACKQAGMKVVNARERDLWSLAGSAYGIDPLQLREQIDGIRQFVGPPWGADQKIATVAALMALA